MPACGQVPSWQGCQEDNKLQSSPREKHLQKKFKPSINCLSKMNCRPAMITQEPAGPPLVYHSNHICGARGGMGRELQNSRGLISFSEPHHIPTTGPPGTIFMGSGDFEAHAEGNFSTPCKPDSPGKPRQAPSCPVQMQQCHMRRSHGSASSGASKYVLTVLAGPGSSLPKYDNSLYMSEVCAKHVHITLYAATASSLGDT